LIRVNKSEDWITLAEAGMGGWIEEEADSSSGNDWSDRNIAVSGETGLVLENMIAEEAVTPGTDFRIEMEAVAANMGEEKPIAKNIANKPIAPKPITHNAIAPKRPFGGLYIKVGGYEINADEGFSMSKLAALLRELGVGAT